jgi:hypothetical protein
MIIAEMKHFSRKLFSQEPTLGFSHSWFFFCEILDHFSVGHKPGLLGSGGREDIGATVGKPNEVVQISGQRDERLGTCPNVWNRPLLFYGEWLSTSFGQS